MEKDGKKIFVSRCNALFDKHNTCTKCSSQFITIGSEENRRKIQTEAGLHTLLCGTTVTNVCDLECRKCEERSEFDGSDVETFHIHRYALYTKSQLESMVYRRTARGLSFRDACGDSKQGAHTGFFLRAEVRGLLSTNRRSANEVFTAFLENLQYPSGSTNESFLACETCAQKAEDDVDALTRVAIDGTATATEGDRPTYSRPECVVHAAKYCVDVKYLKLWALRSLLAYVLKSAKMCGDTKAFTLDLHRKFQRNKHKFQNLYLRTNVENGNKLPSTVLLQFWFSIPHKRA